ncbi:MAG: exodeoxyribonuclease III [Spirochaetaceae bacterium]|nr:exodeoxyribonuclease III [Spirochaetaceae bacterium]
MRLLSWNVNGIRSVEKKGFLGWLASDSPDVLCIQETKASPEQLSEAILQACDGSSQNYYSFWASAKRKGYSGVAIFSKTEPLSISPMGIAEFDDEGRVLIADYSNAPGGGFILINAYFPNSQEAGKRLDYKLRFCDAMMELCTGLVAQGKNIVLCGDYNIAHTEIDLAHPKQNEGNPGYLPEERAWMDTWIEAGFVDTFRSFYPGEKGHYSWWSYRAFGARDRNVGWRLDYWTVNKDFMPQVKKASICTEVMGSDHCPVELDI